MEKNKQAGADQANQTPGTTEEKTAATKNTKETPVSAEALKAAEDQAAEYKRKFEELQAKTDSDKIKAAEERAEKAESELSKLKEKPKTVKPVKLDREKAQFKMQLEKVAFDADGEKLSKPTVQFMPPAAFAHFLKAGARMGYTIEILAEAEGMTPGLKKQVNAAIEVFNELQPLKKGKKKNQLSAIK